MFNNFSKILVGLMLLASAEVVIAQNIKATVSGRVLDSQQTALTEVELTIVDLNRGLERQITSNSQGYFYQAGLDAGRYRIKANKSGFAVYESQEFELKVGDATSLEIQLQVAQIEADVQVFASSSTELQLNEVKLSRSFNQKEMNDLPVQSSGTGRNFYAQARTAPGVATSTSAHRPFAVSGQRPRNNNYLIDSVENNDPNSGFIAGRGVTEQLVSQEAVQSFEIITHNFKAEYGRNSGSIVSLVTKSGTNDFHGSVYEYHNNSAISARNPLLQDQISQRGNLAGFTFGGPVKKNKVHFFGNYEFFRPRGSELRTFQTLTDKERVRAVASVRPLVDLYPQSPNGSRIFTVGTPRVVNQNTYLIRTDIILNNQQTLAFRHNYTDANTDSQGIGNTVSSRVNIHNQTLGGTIHYNYAISPRLFNELRVGYTRQTEDDTFLDPSFLGDPKINGEIGFLIVSGLSLGGPLSFLGRQNFQNNYQISDDVSFQKGNHAIKFGGSFRRLQVNGGAINSGFRGQIFFPSIDAFLAGQALSYNRNVGNPLIGLRRTEFHTYIQDDWKVNTKLTLNFGLRYELNTAPTEAADRILEEYRFRGDKNNFAPRVGFAWSVLPKTVIRGGYGIFYNAIELSFIGLTRFNPPIVGNISAFRPQLPNLASQANAVLPTGLVIPDLNARTPYAQHISFSVERELFNPNSTFTLSYVGTQGRKLSRTRRPNGGENLAQAMRPDPKIGVLNRLETSANSDYHALQFSMSQRINQNLLIRAAYTYSKFIDDVSEITDTNQNLDRGVIPVDENNLRLERAVSDFHIPHIFTVSYIYQLPFFASNRFAGGWTISGITTLQSGRPFTLFSGTNNPLGSNNNRLNDVAGLLVRDPSSITPIKILTGANSGLLTPAVGKVGTLGRNTEVGDSFLETNLSVSKDFALKENLKLQVRAEVFNLFNNSNFGTVETLFTSPNFGRVTSAFDARRTQIAVRVTF